MPFSPQGGLMKKFFTRFAAIAIVAYGFQLVASFVIGASTRSRWDESSGLSLENLPSPIGGGFAAAIGMAVFVTGGFALRFIAYRRLDLAGFTSWVLWIAIVAAEALYAYANLFVLWAATGPDVDAGFAWIAIVILGGIVTGLSAIGLAVVVLVARRRTADPVTN